MSDTTAPTVSPAQFQVIVAEVRAIETQTARAAILAADTTAQYRARLDAAIAAGEISKEFLSELSGQLAIQEQSTVSAIMAANLAKRIDSGDLTQGVQNASA